MTMYPDIQEILRRLFSDSKLDRELAVKALILAEARTSDVLEALISVLRSDPCPTVRAWAASALGHIPWQEGQTDKASLALTEAILSDSDPQVRVSAAAGVRIIHLTTPPSDLVQQRCVQALQVTDPKVIIALIYALEKADCEIDDIIMYFLEHEDFFVRLSAIEVLLRRGHQSERLKLSMERLLQSEHAEETVILCDESGCISELKVYDFVQSLLRRATQATENGR